jgi:hypothetical protein
LFSHNPLISLCSIRSKLETLYPFCCAPILIQTLCYTAPLLPLHSLGPKIAILLSMVLDLDLNFGPL